MRNARFSCHSLVFGNLLDIMKSCRRTNTTSSRWSFIRVALHERLRRSCRCGRFRSLGLSWL